MKGAFLLFLLFSLGSVNYSQTASSADNSVTEFDVNGLKVIFKRRPSSPTVSAGLFTRGGVRNQTAKNAGIEALTLATAAESSKKFPRELLRKDLARTGSTINASMGYDFGVISLSSTRQNFDRTWEIFTDVILNPSLTSEDFQIVRERALTGLRNASVSPDSSLISLEDKIIHAGHPYANSPNGTTETVSGLKIEDLRAYHKTLLQTSRLLLVIVGDLEPQVVQKQITASFGMLPPGNYKEQPIEGINFARSTVDINERSIPTNYVKGIFAAPSLKDPDYHAMRVAMSILQGRIYQEVRVRLNLSYAPNAEMDDNQANTANIYVTSTDANAAVSVMLREIKSMKTESIEDDSFTGVPGFFLTTYYIKQETNAAQVAELARYELIGGGWRNSFEFLNRIREVKPGDVQAVANKYMKNIRFVVIGSPLAVNKPIFLQN